MGLSHVSTYFFSCACFFNNRSLPIVVTASAVQKFEHRQISYASRPSLLVRLVPGGILRKWKWFLATFLTLEVGCKWDAQLWLGKFPIQDDLERCDGNSSDHIIIEPVCWVAVCEAVRENLRKSCFWPLCSESESLGSVKSWITSFLPLRNSLCCSNQAGKVFLFSGAISRFWFGSMFILPHRSPSRCTEGPPQP